MKTGKRTLVLAFLIFALVLGSVGTAFAGTITVNLKSNDREGILWAPKIQPAMIYVYGPSGYYRSVWCSGSALSILPKTMTYKFTNAPVGAYRVRVAWSGRAEANQYPSIGWWIWQQNQTCNFTSPR
jgi:hypothetical protein